MSWPKVQRHRRDGKGKGKGKGERIFYVDVAVYVAIYLYGNLYGIKIIFYFNS